MFTIALPWFPILAVLPQRCTKALKRDTNSDFSTFYFAVRLIEVQTWTQEDLIAGIMK